MTAASNEGGRRGCAPDRNDEAAAHERPPTLIKLPPFRKGAAAANVPDADRLLRVLLEVVGCVLSRLVVREGSRAEDPLAALRLRVLRVVQADAEALRGMDEGTVKPSETDTCLMVESAGEAVRCMADDNVR